MDRREKIRWYFSAAAVCVLSLVLLCAVAEPAARLFSDPEMASFVIYLETGRVVKEPFRATEPPPSQATEPPATEEAVTPTSPQPPQTVFYPEDTGLIKVNYLCDYRVDVETMLLSELIWDLKAEGPKVLIVHSHATESYTQTAQFSYEVSGDYRTLDDQRNMLRVGQALKEALEKEGIGVIHDTAMHDHPSYNDAYVNSRESISAYLRKYPTLSLVIDLHRDAIGQTNKGQLDTHALVNGQESAQIMLVVGSDANGRTHPNWEKNMALATKLHARLEKSFPGLCRPISFRGERFNQDLSEGALLIEVGAAGNTLEEALVAVEALAKGIAELSGGAATADSTS